MITKKKKKKRKSKMQKKGFFETLKEEFTSTPKSEEKKEPVKKKKVKKQHITNDEGCLLLAEAIVKQAKKDYVKHPKGTLPHDSARYFVLNEWFKTLTLNAADPKKTLESWDDDKYVMDIWREIKTKPMFDQESSKAIGKFYRSMIKTNRIIFWDYLSHLNKEGYLVGSEWDEIMKGKDILKNYGWNPIVDSGERAQAFKPVKTTKGYYISIKAPTYLTRTKPKKEVE